MSQAIEFRGDFSQFSQADFEEIMMGFSLIRYRKTIPIIFLGFMGFYIVIFLLESGGDLSRLLSVLFLPLLLLCGLFMILKSSEKIIKQRFLSFVEKIGTVSGEFNESRFSYRTKFSQAEYPWSEICKFNIKCNSLLIYPTPYEIFIISKGFFESPEMWEEATQMVTNQVVQRAPQSGSRWTYQFPQFYAFLAIVAILWSLGSSAFWYFLRESYRSGHEAWEKGNYSKAEQQFRLVVSFYPQSADANHYLAMALHEQNKLDEAEIFYRKALAIDPNSSAAYYSLGNVLYNSNKPQAAITAYRKAIRLKPDYAKVYRRMGDVFYQQGQSAQALTYYERFLELDPNNPMASRVLQRIDQIKADKKGN